MLLLSLAIVPLLVIPLTVDLSPRLTVSFEAIDWMIWAAFALEYGIRLYLAPVKRQFVRGNVIDLVVVVVPFLRPIRVLRSARALRLLRASRVAVMLGRAVDAGGDILRRHKLNYALLVTLFVVVGAGVLVSEVERSAPTAEIKTVADGLWWAVTTVTTVGYGDLTPVTALGRGIAVVLMLMGVGLFGLLAASLASFFIEKQSEDTVGAKLDAISQRLDRIEASLNERPAGESPPGPS